MHNAKAKHPLRTQHGVERRAVALANKKSGLDAVLETTGQNFAEVEAERAVTGEAIKQTAHCSPSLTLRRLSSPRPWHQELGLVGF